jgi:His-Xaa-Ser system protein HxsD
VADVHGREDPSGDGCKGEAVVEHRGTLPVSHGAKGTAALSLSSDVYSLKAVLAAGYKFSDRCAVIVDVEPSGRWVIFLVGGQSDNPAELIETLSRELLDQALRAKLEEEFGSVRTLIVAQAFAEGNLLDPNGDSDDPDVDPHGTRERR